MYIIKSRWATDLVKQLAYLKFSKYSHKFSLMHAKNFCISSGRSWGIVKMYKMSRFRMRKFAHRAYIPGLRRKSW